MNRLGLELNLTFSCAINLANAVVSLSHFLSLCLSLPWLVYSLFDLCVGCPLLCLSVYFSHVSFRFFIFFF